MNLIKEFADIKTKVSEEVYEDIVENFLTVFYGPLYQGLFRDYVVSPVKKLYNKSEGDVTKSSIENCFEQDEYLVINMSDFINFFVFNIVSLKSIVNVITELLNKLQKFNVPQIIKVLTTLDNLLSYFDIQEYVNSDYTIKLDLEEVKFLNKDEIEIKIGLFPGGTDINLNMPFIGSTLYSANITIDVELDIDRRIRQAENIIKVLKSRISVYIDDEVLDF